MRIVRTHLVVGLVMAASFASGAPAIAQTANARGEISRNVYRIPYGDGSTVTMSQDYIDHGSTPAGDTGSMDMFAAGNPAIVAAAAGTVIAVNDALNGCGCSAAYGQCANTVQIQHASGEVSTYLHIAQNSATNLGITVGTIVAQGQQIAVQGDVGWTCGSGRLPTTSPTCTTPVNSVPPGATRCGPHLHWNVVRATTGERVNPMTCGISNNIYVDNGVNTAAPCDGSTCPVNATAFAILLDAFGEWNVFQASNQITASIVKVSNFGSVVLHAGNSVRMLPGFHVDAGGYGRAEIGACNGTAVAPVTAAPELLGVAAALIAERPIVDLSAECEGY